MQITDLFRQVEIITPADAKKLMAETKAGELELIDVREPAEYEKGHIPGARLMPLSVLPSRLDEINKDKPVIAYCARGRRSASAASLMMGYGLEKVYSLEGGIQAWNGNVATGGFDAGMFLVEGLRTIDEHIALAWALEDGNIRFYNAVKDIADDAEWQGLFKELAGSEVIHRSNILKAFNKLKGEDINSSYLKDISSKGFMEGGVLIDDALEWLHNSRRSLRDILELSMQLEINSLDLYFKIMDKAGSEDIMAIFSSIIDEEKAHLIHLGDLLEAKI